MDARDMLPLNPRDFLILLSLEENERHGYGIVKQVEQRSHNRVQLDPANLYRSIKRLIRIGLVAEVDDRPAPEAANERRRFYALTRLGLEVVKLEAERLAELTDAARARNLIPDHGSGA